MSAASRSSRPSGAHFLLWWDRGAGMIGCPVMDGLGGMRCVEGEVGSGVLEA